MSHRKINDLLDNFTILQWNCRSLKARHNDISFLLTENKCQCALLSETWLLPNSRISITDYHVTRQDRIDGYGGVAIVIHKSINSKRIPIIDNIKHLLEYHSIDLVGIEVMINDKKFYLWSIYIPPSSNPSIETFNHIFSLMNRSSLIGGDFNGHHPGWGSASSDFRGNLIFSTLSDYGFCTLNNGDATRINRPPHPDTVVDITVSSPSIALACSWSVLSDPFGSDHLPIIITLPCRSPLEHSFHHDKNSPSRFNFNATDWNLFSVQVASRLESFKLENSPLSNYNNFVNLLLCATNKATPRIYINKRKFPRSPPWWNDLCTIAVKTRSFYFQKFRISRSRNDFLNYQKARVDTAQVLNKAKKASWEKLCSNLDPSTPLTDFWITAKKFKNSGNLSPSSTNDEWFEHFYNKISPSYVSSEAENYFNTPINDHQPHHICSHFSSPFNRQELSLAISSRNSSAAGLDDISPSIFKHLPIIAFDILLKLLNDLWLNNIIPESWRQFRVIPIPKPAAKIPSYRPIALSSAFCKLTEFMLKNRLDWYLEANQLIPDNIFGFRRGIGTMECLSKLTGQIYSTFCKREFLTAAFVDVQGAYDAIHIPTLIARLVDLNVPAGFCNYIYSLFHVRYLHFTSPSGSEYIRSSYRGLPQGSCLSPILFNVYMIPICKDLYSLDHSCLFYADDIVVFSANKSLNIAILHLNFALDSLCNKLSLAFFEVAPDKSQTMIFTRKRYVDFSPIYIDNRSIVPSNSVKYLGLILDPKLRWVPHFNYLKCAISKWSNLLRALAGTWWGAHPSSLLLIFKSIIRSKVDYGSFLFTSASRTQRNKLNALLTSCLRTVIGAVRSAPNICLEVECVCPPLEIRARQLAGKFLLKHISNSHDSIFKMFLSLASNWRYVPKTLPILASIAFSIKPLTPSIIISQNRLYCFDLPFGALILLSRVHILNLFKDCKDSSTRVNMPTFSVNQIFNDFIDTNFHNYCLVYTDGSVSTSSAGFSFFIPKLKIKFSDTLPLVTCSFTAECYAIMVALNYIQSLNIKKCLIISDSQSALYAIHSISFSAATSPLILNIKASLFHLASQDFIIEFLWVPGHAGVSGNEVADTLATSTKYNTKPHILKIPATDLLNLLKTNIKHAWQNKWSSVDPNFAKWYRSLTPTIPSQPWFLKLPLARSHIVRFSRLRLGHNLLPAHAFHLDLNDSPMCTRHDEEAICDLTHILVNCPSFHNSRLVLLSLLRKNNIMSVDPQIILNSFTRAIIIIILNFIQNAGFLI
jgi:ribonuclease HI